MSPMETEVPIGSSTVISAMDWRLIEQSTIQLIRLHVVLQTAIIRSIINILYQHSKSLSFKHLIRVISYFNSSEYDFLIISLKELV